MTKRYYIIIALMIISGFSLTVSIAQQSWKENEQLILNLETAPLKVKLSYNQEYIRVENHSDKSVRGYKLGCVIRNDEKVIVKSAFDVRNVELKPVDEQTNSMYSHSFGIEQSGLMQCNQTKTKLAAIEVIFSDDTIWKIDESLGK